MSADWIEIKTALHDFAARATGIATVIWARQNGPRPPLPFVELSVSADTSTGLADEERQRENETPTPGAELILETGGNDEFTITIEVFVDPDTDDAPARMRRVRRALSKDSEVNSFDAVGLAVIDSGAIQDVSAMLDTEQEGRATFDVRFRYADSSEEPTTFIETVETTDEIDYE